MRHLKEGKKFGRLRGQRRSFLRNIANDVIRAGRVETTEARAKAVRPIVERLVTIGKKQTLASYRLLLKRVHSKTIANKIYRELSPKYSERKGGYLRIIKSAKVRKRDGSRLASIEFI